MPQTIVLVFQSANGKSPFQDWLNKLEETEPKDVSVRPTSWDSSKIRCRHLWYPMASAKRAKSVGLTQKQLADRIHTQQSVISRIEDADYIGHSLAILNRIAFALGKQLRVAFHARPVPANGQAQQPRKTKNRKG